MRSTTLAFLMMVLLVVVFGIAPASASTTYVQQETVGQIVVQDSAGVSSPPVLTYQGRLLDPATGQPKPDGVYAVVFRLYDASGGGSLLWTEAKNITVSRSLFTTLLGDTAALNLAVFNGQDLWLGVTVGADPEATPRQRFAYVPYALYALNADKVDGLDGGAFASASHTHTGADMVDDTITAADIQDFTRVLAFPAAALSYDGTTVTADSAGLNWAATYQGGATLNLTRPTDWNPATDITLRIFFAPTTGTPGNVAFFIRPRSYDPGDTYQDIANTDFTPVPVSGAYKVQVQSMTIPAARWSNSCGSSPYSVSAMAMERLTPTRCA